MNKEEVTLLAATIAASASVITLVLNLRAQKTSELRVSYRQSLEPHVVDLGEGLHEIVATSSIYLFKTKTEEARKNWREKHEKARDNIKAIRTKVRYQLWGLDNGLRVISMIGDHSTHLYNDKYRGKDLIDKATILRSRLDLVIKNCYQRGSPPTFYESFRVSLAAKKTAKVFNNYKAKNNEQA